MFAYCCTVHKICREIAAIGAKVIGRPIDMLKFEQESEKQQE